jgi:hypothetical protein
MRGALWSGAVEERQRGEFWTDCQVQLLLAANIDRRRQKQKFHAPESEDHKCCGWRHVTQVDEAAVCGAFGIWHDH